MVAMRCTRAEDSECLEFNAAAALETLMDHFERMLSGGCQRIRRARRRRLSIENVDCTQGVCIRTAGARDGNQGFDSPQLYSFRSGQGASALHETDVADIDRDQELIGNRVAVGIGAIRPALSGNLDALGLDRAVNVMDGGVTLPPRRPSSFGPPSRTPATVNEGCGHLRRAARRPGPFDT